MGSEPAERACGILDVDLAGIAANWRSLVRRVEPAGCAAVVKADAYGLGAHRVSAALAQAGCRLFFVATADEGIALRGVLAEPIEIAVFNGVLRGSADEFVKYRLIPVLNDPGQIVDWRDAAVRNGGLPAMLHLDTGMARLGLTAREFDRISERLKVPGAIGWRALISHLACADEPAHPLNETQRARFASARAAIGAMPCSLAASSGIFLGRGFYFDFVRPGAALYGVNPQPGAPNPMRRIVRLKGRILQIREVDRGESVGYGATHTMVRAGRLATVAVGYADGWLRSLSHRGSGRIGGKRVPLLGRISMDLAVFDVSEIDPARACPGGFIDLLDEDYDVDAAAADADTIGYEILTGLGRRYHRIYRDAADQW
ncbi:MAG: alanine racemase [Alphaproteobacteria bacterium]|nr:alanine racemase [Alphaproteobacteria bacterium]